MKLNDYSSLLSELRKGERQRVYILTGERGLGKHSVLSAAAETIKETAPDATILSVHPDAFSFSLWPMEEALRQSTPDAALPSHEMKDGLNYPEQLIRSILELCSGKKRTIIFLNRLQSFNDDLWSFTTKLLRLLLDPYRSFNVCFCCCLHTDGVLRSQSSTQTRSADQLIGLFSRYPQSTCYLYFHPWSREGLQRFLENELFQGKLRMAPGQRGLLLDAAMGNPATLINLTERMKARGLLYEENGFYCCGSIDGTVLLTCGPVPATEEYTRMEHPLQELLRGSSVIGVEFATFYANLGCRVTLIEGMDRLLPTMDRELGQNLGQILKKQGVEVLTSAMVRRVEQTPEGLTVHVDQKGKEKAVSGEKVLCAIGRRPCWDGLFAPELVPETRGRSLLVDEDFRTSIPGVYAIGDVSAVIQLAHVAAAQGIACVNRMCGRQAATDLNVVPSCIYSSPEIAVVGLTEAEAKEQGINAVSGKCTMFGNARTVIEDPGRCFMKLVADRDTGRLIGAQLMCQHASDIISQLSAALVNGLTVGQLLSVMRPHPSFEEAMTEALERLAEKL